MQESTFNCHVAPKTLGALKNVTELIVFNNRAININEITQYMFQGFVCLFGAHEMYFFSCSCKLYINEI